MNKIYLKVRKSKVGGSGLFTNNAIKKGTVIGVFESRECTKKDLKSIYRLEFDEDTGKHIQMVCKFKFINHSSNQNVYIWDDFTITASRDIKKGEELFSNYGQKWVDNCGHEVF